MVYDEEKPGYNNQASNDSNQSVLDQCIKLLSSAEVDSSERDELFLTLVAEDMSDAIYQIFQKQLSDPTHDLNKFLNPNALTQNHPKNLHAIHIAICKRSMTMLNTLIHNNPNLRIPDDSILHAVHYNFFEAVELLYSFVEHDECPSCYPSDEKSSMIQVDKISRFKVAHRLIIGSVYRTSDRECNNIFTHGITPLMLAAKNDNYHMVQHILELQKKYPKTVDPYLTREEYLKPSQFVNLKLTNKQLLLRIIPDEIIGPDTLAYLSYYDQGLFTDQQIPEDLQFIFDSSYLLFEYMSWRWWLFCAKTSPAMMISASEEFKDDEGKNLDLFSTTFKCFEELDEIIPQSSSYSDQYTQLRTDLELFLRDLMTLVNSSSELSHLFKYDAKIRKFNRNDKWIFHHPEINEHYNVKSINQPAHLNKQSLEILNKCINLKLKGFMMHPNTQQVLTFFTYRYTPWVKTSQKWFHSQLLLRFLGGIFYPLFCWWVVLLPNTRVSDLIQSPWFIHSLGIGSEIWFLLLLIIHPMYDRRIEFYGRGVAPNLLEWLILLFVVGKIVEESREWKKRGKVSYFKDLWNWVDLVQIMLLVVAILSRAFDYFWNSNCRVGDYDFVGSNELNHFNSSLFSVTGNESTPHHVPQSHMVILDPSCRDRTTWHIYEPRFISEACMSLSATMVFIRVLSLLRTFKTIGPNQTALWKMARDIGRVSIFFILLLISFSTATIELYRYYYEVHHEESKIGSEEHKCLEGQETVRSIGSNILTAMGLLFWASLDFTDNGDYKLSQCEMYGNHMIPDYVMQVLIGVFSVLSVIVMVNMVIAMMTKTYESSTQNLKQEWYFNRATVFIRYIRHEWPRPVPMNLLPDLSYHWTKLYYKIFRKRSSIYFPEKEKKRWKSGSETTGYSDMETSPLYSEIYEQREKFALNARNKRYLETLRLLQDRYKIKKRESNQSGWILESSVEDNPFQNLPQINDNLRPDMNPNQMPAGGLTKGLRNELTSASTNMKKEDSMSDSLALDDVEQSRNRIDSRLSSFNTNGKSLNRYRPDSEVWKKIKEKVYGKLDTLERKTDADKSLKSSKSSAELSKLINQVNTELGIPHSRKRTITECDNSYFQKLPSRRPSESSLPKSAKNIFRKHRRDKSY